MIRLLSNHSFPGAPDHAVQLQPAGFDLSAAAVARFGGTGELDFANLKRRLPELEELPWQVDARESDPRGLLLEAGAYLVTYNEEISVPPDCAGIVLPRSSLMRCGAVLHSALWDPGYRGRGQGLLTVYSPLFLHKDARIGQFVLLALETAAQQLYSGRYQGDNLEQTKTSPMV
jgi:dUTP pyrophosphatase